MNKSLDEQMNDVWHEMSEKLNNTWWIVQIFTEYLILAWNDKYYQVNYSYDMEDELMIDDQMNWIEVKQEWIAKKMQEKITPAIAEDKLTPEDDKEDMEKSDMSINVSFISKASKKQIVYSVVYEPEEVDTQGDWADEEEIEKMAHSYLRRHLETITEAADLEHEYNLDLSQAVPVESYIAPVNFSMNDQEIKKGSWVVAMHIPDNEIWQQIEKGDITGYSLRGRGLRIPKEL